MLLPQTTNPPAGGFVVFTAMFLAAIGVVIFQLDVD